MLIFVQKQCMFDLFVYFLNFQFKSKPFFSLKCHNFSKYISQKSRECILNLIDASSRGGIFFRYSKGYSKHYKIILITSNNIAVRFKGRYSLLDIYIIYILQGVQSPEFEYFSYASDYNVLSYLKL